MKLTRSATLHLRIGRGTLRAEALARGATLWVAESTYATTPDLAELIARLVGECAVSCKRMRVAFEHPLAQLRTLRDVPQVGERDLAALVHHHASRFFRKNGSPLVTDAVW